MPTRRWLATALVACIIQMGAVPARADSPTDAVGIVVAVDESHHVVRTVPLAGGRITGQELLEQSGLGLTQNQGFVCSIAGVGCDYPAEECMCALPLYWAYSHWQNGAWSYSGVGAAAWTLGPGDVDGWTWGAEIALPDMDDLAFLDNDRLAPGIPVFVSTADAVGVQLPFAGDENGDATVTVTWRHAGGEVRDAGSLARHEAFYDGVALLPSKPGAWNLELTCVDPDGVNGSAVWRYSVVMEGMYTVQCPLILDTTVSNP